MKYLLNFRASSTEAIEMCKLLLDKGAIHNIKNL